MTFLMHKILRLKASAEHTQFRKLEVSVSLLTPNNFFDSQKREKGLEKHDVKKTNFLFQINSCLTKGQRDPYIEISRRKEIRWDPYLLQKQND